ncbi:MAG: tRNA (adenosine(37)-N6)-threonylcarbamoyltransferase complex dimerization subunit type 1 TsaB [Anaerolineae bacterium]|nr:tRNA (adenosine(37)-N6)-threonylcarbamoyltransferase complex dimerization subunit type 1 TsaB [Anaerolineae bacterium]
MLLAIDTATSYTSLALHSKSMVIAEHTWFSPSPNHAVELAPAVQRMLDQGGVTIQDLTALAVCIGPGSFTGLRVGVALAKGIAAARQLPLVGVSSLDIVAAGHPQVSGGLIALVQAGRGRIVAGTYQWRKGRWKRRGEPRLMTWDSLLESIDGPATVTGEIDADGLAALAMARQQEMPITITAAVQRLRRAGFLAEEAWTQIQESADHDPARVIPLYVKTKDLG